MSEDASKQDRRGFLATLLAGVAVSVGLLLYPVARFLKPRAAAAAGSLEVVAPFKANELRADAEGRWPPPFNFGGRPCLVIKTSNGEIRAFDAICSHIDCTVAFRPDKKDIFCSCHNGVYDLTGRNVSGPPPRPLETYKVTLRGKAGQEDIVVSRG